MKRSSKHILISLGLAGLAALIVAALRPAPVRLELAAVRRGDLRVTVEGDGRTRIRHKHQLLAPVSGDLARITLRAGDAVSAGQVLGRIRPLSAPLLDPRTRAEAEARFTAAEASQREAAAAVERARVGYQRASRDLERARTLAAKSAMSRQELEQAEFNEELRGKEVRAAELAVETARRNVELARMSISRPEALRAGKTTELSLTASRAGRVLRVYRDEEGPVQAGASLLELGDPADLELVVELLTSEAVRVRPGAPAHLDGWGGEPLQGKVRLLEPSAFTKVSPLGVEEQRVNALIDLPTGDAGASLGDGYHVHATITVEEVRGALLVPGAALFRQEERWATYVIEGGRVRRRAVAPGRRGQGQAELLSGLAEGAQVVLYPDDTLREGLRARAR